MLITIAQLLIFSIFSYGFSPTNASTLASPSHASLEICSTAEIWQLRNGRQLVRDFRNRALLLVFMPQLPDSCQELQRGDCDELFELEMYEAIVGRMGRDVRVEIVAHRDEMPSRLKRVTKRFRKLRFEQASESEPIWEWLGVNNSWEQLIYDKCSRLSARLSMNGSTLAGNHFHFHETLRALRAASELSPCGECKSEARIGVGTQQPPFGPAPTPEVYPKRLIVNLPPTHQPHPSYSHQNPSMPHTMPHATSTMPPATSPYTLTPQFEPLSKPTDENSPHREYKTRSATVVNAPPNSFGELERLNPHSMRAFSRSTANDSPVESGHYRQRQAQSNQNTHSPTKKQRDAEVTVEETRHQWYPEQQLYEPGPDRQQYRIQSAYLYATSTASPESANQGLQEKVQFASSLTRDQQVPPPVHYPPPSSQPSPSHRRPPTHSSSHSVADRFGSNDADESWKAVLFPTPPMPASTRAPVRYSEDPYSRRYPYALGERNWEERLPTARANKQGSDRKQEKGPAATPTNGNTNQRQSPGVASQRDQREREYQERVAEWRRQNQLHLQQQQQSRSPNHQTQSYTQQSPPVQPTRPFIEPAPLYPDEMPASSSQKKQKTAANDEEDYMDYSEETDSWTTPDPETMQIPKPSSPNPAWPTPLALAQRQDRSYTGLDLPCGSYTDEICFQQQAQLRPEEIHQCCRERILLSEHCLPGRCNNVTQQLCCIQKFLQAKLSCCLDPSQGQTPTGDHFSRCCHQHFVGEDEVEVVSNGREKSCCSRSYAKKEWKSVNELCLPNVDVDLSKVKVPNLLPGTSLTTEFDFGQTDKLRFTCKYGTHVQQYAYDEEENEEEGEGEN